MQFDMKCYVMKKSPFQKWQMALMYQQHIKNDDEFELHIILPSLTLFFCHCMCYVGRGEIEICWVPWQIVPEQNVLNFAWIHISKVLSLPCSTTFDVRSDRVFFSVWNTSWVLQFVVSLGCMRSKIRETVATCKQLKSEKNIKFPTDDLKIGLPSSRGFLAIVHA